MRSHIHWVLLLLHPARQLDSPAPWSSIVSILWFFCCCCTLDHILLYPPAPRNRPKQKYLSGAQVQWQNHHNIITAACDQIAHSFALRATVQSPMQRNYVMHKELVHGGAPWVNRAVSQKRLLLSGIIMMTSPTIGGQFTISCCLRELWQGNSITGTYRHTQSE